jgi:hypothetical protein
MTTRNSTKVNARPLRLGEMGCIALNLIIQAREHHFFKTKNPPD